MPSSLVVPHPQVVRRTDSATDSTPLPDFGSNHGQVHANPVLRNSDNHRENVHICRGFSDGSSRLEDTYVSISTVKSILQSFLKSVPYRSPHTPQNPEMRRVVTAEIMSWDAGLSANYISGLMDTSCSIAESGYAHTSYEHQLLVAIYTAYLTFADDQGQNDVEGMGQFVQRFTRGQPQAFPALERLTTLLGTVHDFYPRISSDAIITNTIDSITGMYIELTTKDDVIVPGADRYPFYLRLKTGIASAYAHLIFTKTWGEEAGTYYLQLLPELELVIVGINDILSFYKETLAGETDNYVHMRASAEQKPPITVLQQLADECLQSLRKIELLASAQPGLAFNCQSFIMGYIEFHFKARRYRLEEVVAGF